MTSDVDYASISMQFPQKLYIMMQKEQGDIVQWASNGICFRITDQNSFAYNVVPKYFKHTKLTSFQRQLNLYGFRRLVRGENQGCYFHPKFQRGRKDLLQQVRRLPAKDSLPSYEQALLQLSNSQMAKKKLPSTAVAYPTAVKQAAQPFFQRADIVPAAPASQPATDTQLLAKRSAENVFRPIDAQQHQLQQQQLQQQLPQHQQQLPHHLALLPPVGMQSTDYIEQDGHHHYSSLSSSSNCSIGDDVSHHTLASQSHDTYSRPGSPYSPCPFSPDELDILQLIRFPSFADVDTRKPADEDAIPTFDEAVRNFQAQCQFI